MQIEHSIPGSIPIVEFFVLEYLTWFHPRKVFQTLWVIILFREYSTAIDSDESQLHFLGRWCRIDFFLQKAVPIADSKALSVVRPQMLSFTCLINNRYVLVKRLVLQIVVVYASKAKRCVFIHLRQKRIFLLFKDNFFSASIFLQSWHGFAPGKKAISKAWHKCHMTGSSCEIPTKSTSNV